LLGPVVVEEAEIILEEPRQVVPVLVLQEPGLLVMRLQ